MKKFISSCKNCINKGVTPDNAFCYWKYNKPENNGCEMYKRNPKTISKKELKNLAELIKK